MCGRFARNTIPKALRDILMELLPVFLPNYNIAPTQTALIAVNEYDKRAISRKEALRGITGILFSEIQALMDEDVQGRQ